MTDPNYHAEEENSYEEKIEKLVTMTVAAAKGIVPAGQVMLPLMQIAGSSAAPPQIRAFAAVLLEVAKGNKTPALTADLPPDLVRAVQQALARIEAPLPDAGTEREGLSLAELLERVAEACAGNLLLWQQLWDFTEALQIAPTTPPDIKLLAVALRKILAGERQEHAAAGLPPALAGPVTALLAHLREQGSFSG